MLTTADFLKYANLQMAAEAFLVRDDGTVRDDIVTALVAGNTRSLLFTQTQAEAFADPNTGWTVLDQEANTTTGFSGKRPDAQPRVGAIGCRFPWKSRV